MIWECVSAPETIVGRSVCLVVWHCYILVVGLDSDFVSDTRESTCIEVTWIEGGGFGPYLGRLTDRLDIRELLR